MTKLWILDQNDGTTAEVTATIPGAELKNLGTGGHNVKAQVVAYSSATVIKVPPLLTDAPELLGYGVAGTDLSAQGYAFTGATTVNMRTLLNGAVVSAGGYTIPTNAPVGDVYDVQIEGVSAGGASTGWISAGTVTVTDGPVLLQTGRISGDASVNSTLTAVDWVFSGAAAVQDRWLSNGSIIPGAASASFVPNSSYAASTIDHERRAQDSAGRWSAWYRSNDPKTIQPPPLVVPDALTSAIAKAVDVPSVGGNQIAVRLTDVPYSGGSAILKLWCEIDIGSGYGTPVSLPWVGVGDYQFTATAGAGNTARVWTENAVGPSAKLVLSPVTPSVATTSISNLTSVTHNGVTYTISATSTPGTPVPVGTTVDGAPYVVGTFWIISDPTPNYVVGSSGNDLNRGMNGYQKNPSRGKTQYWDKRASSGFATPIDNFPLQMNPGDVFTKVVSRTNVSTAATATNDGVPTAYSQIECFASTPGPKRFSSPAIWPAAQTANRPIIEADVDAIYASLPSYDMTGMDVVTWADVAFFVDKHEFAFGKDSSATSGDGYETMMPFQFGSGNPSQTTSSANYGQGITQTTAGLLLGLIGNNWSASDKKAAIKRVIQLGTAWYYGFAGAGASISPNGGHYQFHQAIMALALKWCGLTAELANFHANMTGNFKGARRASVAVRNGVLTPHTSTASSSYACARQRIARTVSGTSIEIPFSRAGSGGGPDGSNLNIYKLRLKHVPTGELRSVLTPSAGIGNLTSGVVSYRTLGVDSPFTSAVAGDAFCFYPQWELGLWEWLWSIAGAESSVNYWAGNFWPNASAQYFNIQEWTTMLLAMVACGISIPAGGYVENAIYLTIRANKTNEPAGADFPNFKGSCFTSARVQKTWPSDFYAAYGATIFAPWLAADTTAPTISALSSTIVSAGASTLTVTTNKAQGGVFAKVYSGAAPTAAAIMADYLAGVAGTFGIDVSAAGSVSLPISGVAPGNTVAVVHQDWSGNNSTVLTRTL